MRWLNCKLVWYCCKIDFVIIKCFNNNYCDGVK